MFPDATEGMARLVAESSRLAMQQPVFSGIAEDASFTASFGVAEASPSGTYGSLFAKADGALYAAKESGRNRVRSFQHAHFILQKAKA